MKSNMEFNSGKAKASTREAGPHHSGMETRPESDSDRGIKGEPGPSTAMEKNSGVHKNSMKQAVKHIHRQHNAKHHMLKKHKVS